MRAKNANTPTTCILVGEEYQIGKHQEYKTTFSAGG